jgi:hypothetical protein
LFHFFNLSYTKRVDKMGYDGLYNT